MPRPRIASFVFAEENEAKLAAYRLTPRQVLQVLEDEHLVVPNRKRRRGRYLIK